ncbi:glycosyltransferase family 2 protein [Patescibacteria group bacterium]
MILSIIIPAYNHGEELPKCLDSIFAQSYNDFEVIVVNDGSTDGTEEVLEKYCGVQVINQENQGAPVARNNGFNASKGEYVIFCDADVVFKKDALEKMLRAIEKRIPLTPLKKGGTKEIDSVLHNGETGKNKLVSAPLHEGGQGDVNGATYPAYAYPNFKFGWKKFKPGKFSSEKLKKMNYIHTTALIRRECFPANGFDTKLKKFQDWDLWLAMLENGHRGIWLPETLFTVKPRRSGMSEWLPSFMYKIPWKKFGIKIKAIEEYEKWREVVMGKHGLD